MKKVVVGLVLVFLLFLIPTVDAQVSTKDQVANENGYCAWASLETLAKSIGEKKLYGLLNDKKLLQFHSGTSLDDIDVELKSRHVEYTLNTKKDYKFLKDSIEDGGCVVGVLDWPYEGGCHAIMVFSVEDTPLEIEGKKWDKHIKFHDPNRVGSWYSVCWLWMDEHWFGYGVKLKKPAKK